MRTESSVWREGAGWSQPSKTHAPFEAHLALVFAARAAFARDDFMASLRALYPRAHILGCSTGGQIVDADVSDAQASCLALGFARTDLAVAQAEVLDKAHSFAAGAEIGAALTRSDLSAVFILSDGLNVNGSELVAGLRAKVAPGVVITGGLAGDGPNFQKTLVHIDGTTRDHLVVAVGFYGPAIQIGHGSAGGWSQFGPRRAMTRSSGATLYELDGKPALDLYKAYLGEEAEGLPGAALLYPLLVADPANPRHATVRTILAIDEAEGSMTFAGDMPQGWSAQLMRGDFDRLAAAAEDAAANAMAPMRGAPDETAAVLISCIGRRILMGEHIVDEIESAQRALGAAACAGFYSYGEISPHAASGVCELHNQTMTVTTFSEAV